jgi:hypothetical protein
VIPARARLLVVEIVGPDADGQAFGELRVLDMRTEAEYRRLVAAHGFRLTRVAPLRATSP